ncbi:MAG: FAD-binding oxidoreductase [Pseudomonadota bacterium]
MKPPAQAMERLRRIVGPKGWTTDANDMAPHLEDWRRLHRGACAMLLKPATADEVRRIVACADEYGIRLVPQGGNTGLVGGGIPDASGEQVMVSLSRLRAVRGIDAMNYTMTVEAGLTLAEAQAAAAAADRLFPLSIGAEGSAQIGGLVSTNAGGVAVLRYGAMRDLVLGLEAVLPDGTLWRGLGGLRKDNTGYDLKQLLIGAEGTLGIITAATLKLFPAIRTRATALAAVPSPAAAVKLLALAREVGGETVSSFELMPRFALELVLKHIPATADPLARAHPWYVLMDLASSRAKDDLRARLEELLAIGLDHALILDGTIASSHWQGENLWRIRHSISEAERADGVSIKHDVSVPVAALPAFIAEATQACAGAIAGVRVLAFGHIGDGNVHFNLQQPEAAEPQAFRAQWSAINRLVHDLVIAHGGSISAEHGIGVLKRQELAHYQPEKCALMRRVKAALDPKGIMNPGKLI